MIRPPKYVLDNGHLNPAVIDYNLKIKALFRLLMLLYKLDVHTLTDYTGQKGYAPKLIVMNNPIWKIEVDYKVPLKTIKYYGKQ